MQLYTEENIEKIEAYLAGRLDREQIQDFEKQLAEDQNFRKFFEQHRLLVESLQLSSLNEEIKQMEALDVSSVGQDFQKQVEEDVEKEKRKRRFHNLRNLTATLALGLVIGFGLNSINWDSRINSPLVADNTVDPEENFGGQTKGLPLYEDIIALTIIKETDEGISKARKDIPVIFFRNSSKEVECQIDEEGLEIYLPGSVEITDWENDKIEIIAQKFEVPSAITGFLQIQNKTYQIISINEAIFMRLETF